VRQKPASANAALAALHRLYAWAAATRRLRADPTAKLKPVPSQALAPQGFDSVERARLRRAAERAGPMTNAIVTTLLNTGLRVSELVRLDWADVIVRERSGSAVIRGKRDKVRVVPFNAAVREALAAIRPADEPPAGPLFRGKRGAYTDRGIRNLLSALGRRSEVEHVHPHRFRHDAARRLVEQVDLPTVVGTLAYPTAHSRC
jgi:integrase/recombinase XerD